MTDDNSYRPVIMDHPRVILAWNQALDAAREYQRTLTEVMTETESETQVFEGVARDAWIDSNGELIIVADGTRALNPERLDGCRIAVFRAKETPDA